MDGELAAFPSANHLQQHLRRAYRKGGHPFSRAYPAMAQAFAAHFAMDYTYLNREEDLGIPGLRKSKLSYYPELLLEKWTATCDTPEKLL
ncbi:MAG: phosphatidylglycerol lysyltransferase domain-containing protein [Ruminococcus sp.]